MPFCHHLVHGMCRKAEHHLTGAAISFTLKVTLWPQSWCDHLSFVEMVALGVQLEFARQGCSPADSHRCSEISAGNRKKKAQKIFTWQYPFKPMAHHHKHTSDSLSIHVSRTNISVHENFRQLLFCVVFQILANGCG